MLKAMESYSADEEASHASFFEIYHKIVFETLNVGKLLHIETHSFIEMLKSRRNKADDAYRRGLLELTLTFIFLLIWLNYMKRMEKKRTLDGAMHTYFPMSNIY